MQSAVLKKLMVIEAAKSKREFISKEQRTGKLRFRTLKVALFEKSGRVRFSV